MRPTSLARGFWLCRAATARWEASWGRASRWSSRSDVICRQRLVWPVSQGTVPSLWVCRRSVRVSSWNRGSSGPEYCLASRTSHSSVAMMPPKDSRRWLCGGEAPNIANC